MAEMFETDVSDYSFFTADADLRTKQYFIVKRTDTGVALCTSSDEPFGILVNKPNLAQAAKVRIKGMSRVRVTAAGLARGVQYGADDNGRAVAVTADKGLYLGECHVAGPSTLDGLATVSVEGGIKHTLSV